jgi:tetratricopeptide (TPR) repeat protein
MHIRELLGGTLVAKKRLLKSIPGSSVSLSSQDKLQTQLQTLLEQQKYRQALDAIQKAQRSQPDVKFTPSEAEIWLLRGKQEVDEGEFKLAEKSLNRALELGLTGEPYYWLAKSLVALDRLDDAIALIRPVFENGSLPKDYSICYAKLLLLTGDVEAVEQLLKKQSKRFSAAQQHWIRGVLALKGDDPEAALTSFQKVKQPVTPGDRPIVWQVYTQQILGEWDAAALRLGLGMQTQTMWSLAPSRPTYTQHLLLQRLALLQHVKTGHPPLEQMTFAQDDQAFIELVDVLSLIEFIDEKNPHEAAHLLLNQNSRSTQFPELASIRPALLTLAGQQSLEEGEMSCAAEFWQILQKEQGFDPQLAVNLMAALNESRDYQNLQRLLTRLLKWLEQEIKQHPQNWTDERRKAALTYGYCRLADTLMALGRERTALGELQKAEEIDPRSPEVIGRHGLLAVMNQRTDEAIQLLTQALEQGCRYREVYFVLVNTLKQAGDSEAVLDARRRFGKKFGDLNPEADVNLLPWVDALSTRNYPLFSSLVEDSSDRSSPMRACQIFVEAVEGEPNSGGNVSLNQKQATKAWDQLLESLSAKEQVPTVQAIALCLIAFAKREKGIVALITNYMAKLIELWDQQPEARPIYLVLLALKERDPKKLQTPVQLYLATQPQPGNALARIQLEVRRYTKSVTQDQILRSLLDEYLKREPQNPLLLLAKATTYSPNTEQYETLKQQGFEIARRLQDAKALQAFREEEAFLTVDVAQQFLPDPSNLQNFGLGDMDEMLENMIRSMFGNKIPPAELKRMMPDLKRMMMSEMPDLVDGDDDDFGFGFGFPGGGSPPGGSSRRKRR